MRLEAWRCTVLVVRRYLGSTRRKSWFSYHHRVMVTPAAVRPYFSCSWAYPYPVSLLSGLVRRCSRFSFGMESLLLVVDGLAGLLAVKPS